ncbi:hypothetical protein WJ972_05855 [Achromobacter insuavis]
MPPLADRLGLDGAMPAERRDSVWLDAAALSRAGLGQITAVAARDVTVGQDLRVATGGLIELYAPNVSIQGDLTARGGRVAAGNVLQSVEREVFLAPAANTSARVEVAPGVSIDVSGLWANLRRAPEDADALGWRNGGQIALRGTGAVAVAAGSVLDARSGATLDVKGKLSGGKGGDVALEQVALNGSVPGPGPVGVSLAGTIYGYGVNGGGTLRVGANRVLISDAADADAGADGLVLRGGLFQRGFARYDINGAQGLTVADGMALDVTMPVYRPRSDTLDPLAASFDDALMLWTPPLFQENAVSGRMSQRLGASLSLSAFVAATPQTVGTLLIGQGAVLRVDPGQAIRLQSRGLMRVQGTLQAPGGQIVVARGADDQGATAQLGGLPNSVWIESGARLDVGGIAATAVDARGRRYGKQLDGGRIAIDGEFVVIRPGAVLEASGSAMTVDVPLDDGAGAGARRVGGKGGEIALAATAGLYLDGTMRAAAGGASAAGGALSLKLETPLYATGTQQPLLRPRELRISQTAGASLLPADVTPETAALDYGLGRIGMDQIAAGGFGDVSLYARDLLTFDGDVTLQARQSISLYQGALGNTRAGATVRIIAPYVLLSGRTSLAPAIVQQVEATLNAWKPSALPGAALFEVDADQIDIRNRVNAGMSGAVRLGGGSQLAIERRGYDNMALRSRGDLRFLATAGATDIPLSGQNDTSTVLTAGNLLLAGQRVYPATGAKGLAVAGWRGVGVPYDADAVLRIEGVAGPRAAAAPLSVFGALTLNAPNVEQGGNVFAPLGRIVLGIGINGDTRQVRLLPGSLTSVSAAGLTVPYGGTVDGLSYLYQGAPVEAVGVGGTNIFQVVRGISLLGGSIAVDAGAVIDLSGGGTLAGAGFISGRGGSTDPLFHPLPRFDAATGKFDLPALSDRPVYAIMPGLADGCAGGAARRSQRLCRLASARRRDHHDRRRRARPARGHLYLAAVLLRTVARRLSRRTGAGCAGRHRQYAAGRILVGGGHPRPVQHRHRGCHAAAGAGHPRRRAAAACPVQRDGLQRLRAGRGRAQRPATADAARRRGGAGVLLSQPARRRAGAAVRRPGPLHAGQGRLWRPAAGSHQRRRAGDRQRHVHGIAGRYRAAGQGPERGGRQPPVAGRLDVPARDDGGPPAGHHHRIRRRRHRACRRPVAGARSPADRRPGEVDRGRTRRDHQYAGDGRGPL